MTQEISTQELSSLVSQGTPLRLLEALSPEHFAREHLPGAENLPLQSLEARVRELGLEEDGLLVTYCSGPTCANSQIAARKLEELGYANVRVYAGGKLAWREAGFAFERGAKARYA
jgi:rhodanese-related sulfurtransferase